MFAHRGSNAGRVAADTLPACITAILQKPTAPLASCVFVNAELGSHIFARYAIRTSQDHAASLRKRPSNTVTTNLPLQVRPFLHTQHQRRDRPGLAYPSSP